MNRRRNEHRRRSGCWACKKKHVQCTEERPSCSRCVKSSLDCQYGIRLLWKEDAAQRNICLGREGKWNKTAKKLPASRTDPGDLYEPLDLSAYTGEWIFLNATKNDFNGSALFHEDLLSSDETEDDIPASSDLVLSKPPRFGSAEIEIFLGESTFRPERSLSLLSSVSSIDGNLFDYFVKSIGPSCSLSPSQNPYLYFLAPMSFEFPVLRNSLLAASANQLRLLGDRRFEREAWSHKSKAIRGVQSAIDSGHVDVGIVATVLMLCFYDISDGCKRSWVTHLRGGISLLDKISQTPELRNDKLLSFLRMYFVAHDIMSRTACDEDIVDQRCEWVEDDTIDEIDVMMGCSRSLMNLVREISSLASHAKIQFSKESKDSLEILALVASRDTLERSLHSLEQTLPAGSDETSDLPRIAETKRLTALLYLRERLGMLPSTLPQNETAPSSSAYRIQLITSIISLIKTLPNSPTLLWPLFILGNTSSGLDESQRRFVHERLTALQKVRNLGSVRRARLVVEDTWKKIDLVVDETRNENSSIRNNQNLISLA